MQLALVFRLFLSYWINPGQEVVNAGVLVGAVTAVVGSILVSLDPTLTVGVPAPARDRRLPAPAPRGQLKTP